jgi:hypothetical protein
MRKIYMDIVESNLGWLDGVPGIEVGLLLEEGRFRRHATYDGRALDVVRLALYRDAWLAIREYVLPLFRLGAGTSAQTRRHVPARAVDQPAGRPSRKRLGIVARYLRRAREGSFEDIMAMVTDDVVFTAPLTGAVTGRPQLEALLRFRHRMLERALEASAPQPPIEWLPPRATESCVSVSGSAAPGPIELSWTFNAADKITAITIDAAPELMTAYLLSARLPVEE